MDSVISDYRQRQNERKQNHKNQVSERMEEISNLIREELEKRFNNGTNGSISRVKDGNTYIGLKNDELEDKGIYYNFVISVSDMITYDSPYNSNIKVSVDASSDYTNPTYFYERKTKIDNRVSKIVDEAVRAFNNVVDDKLYHHEQSNEEDMTCEFIDSMGGSYGSHYEGDVEVKNTVSSMIQLTTSVDYNGDNGEEIKELVKFMNDKMKELGLSSK